MAGFFSKLFGGKKAEAATAEAVLKETVEGLLENANLDLSFEIKKSTSDNGEVELLVDLYGNDEEALKQRKGDLLDAIQLFLKRVVQHQFSEDKTNIVVDCSGFRDEFNQALIERAEHLKSIAIEQGKSVYYRALPPKERKIVHQYLAKDPRVKSRSLGEGLFKKIKIYPVKGQTESVDDTEREQEAIQE